MTLHCDGTAWSEMTTSEMYSLQALWGTSSTDVYAVVSKILHYDGAEWSEMASGIKYRVEAVWGMSSSDLFAGRGYGEILRGTR